ncbi:MAG: cellulase family glycosylhydrolase [Oscillospiraceae bacterium]|nr:cellulase family glycosylhydrolase [Oscillospiraceae bacterium]
MKFRRAICLILSVLMALTCLTACGGEAQTATQETQTATLESSDTDAEIQKAIELGFVSKDLQKDYDAQISYAEYCSILDSFVSLISPEAMPDWEKRSEKFHDAEDLMSRIEGAVVLLYAAECCGVDHIGYEYNIALEDLYNGPSFLDEVAWNYPLLPTFHNEPYYNQTIAESEHYSWRCDYDYANNAEWFVEYMSYGNGKTYFDYDENWSLNFADAFTRGDAIRAVERLYENARFAKFIPLSEALCTVSDAALSLASQMPEATYKQLPDWHGYTVVPGNWTVGMGAGMLYDREHIELLGDYGFNFIRAPLDSRVVFNGSDMSTVCAAYLENMDDLIEYCAEEGIHVCFDLHDMPGFYTGGDDSKITLWDDEETQQIFVELWRFLAEYYKDVPSNLLSFNLLNEPHSFDEGPSDEIYSEIMLRAIDVIREITPDRLIFVDTLGVINGAPVQGLADAKVVQTIHSYFLRDGAQNWPSYAINQAIHKNEGELVINGNFPAGTVISANITGVHLDSTFHIKADGSSVMSREFGTEKIGENSCSFIGEEGTGGEYRMYKGLSFGTKLTKDCSQIRITQDKGQWYLLASLTINTGSYSVTFTGNGNVVPAPDVAILNIDENGVVTAENSNTLVLQDRQWFVDLFESYKKFSEETGTLFMVQEFGFNHTIDHKASIAAADDFLSVLDEYKVPWCSWTDGFGPLTYRRIEGWSSQITWGPPKKADGDYTKVAENWIVDVGLMEVFQKHMK